MTLIKTFESFVSSQGTRIFVANPDAESVAENAGFTETNGIYQGENLEDLVESLESAGFSSPHDFIHVPLSEALGEVKYLGHESTPKGTEIFITINGHKYGYKEKEGGMNIADIARKFEKMLQFSSGKALSWLKKNTVLSSGGKSSEATDSKSVKEGKHHEDHDMEDHLPMDAATERKELKSYMFFQNLNTIKKSIDAILAHDPYQIDHLLDNGHNWAEEHVATSKDDIQEVCDWICYNLEQN